MGITTPERISENRPDRIIHSFSAFVSASSECLFHSGSSRTHSPNSLLALSASNSGFKGKSPEFASRSVLILTARFHRALGIVPIFLSEISPPAFRSTFPGVTYQLGNMVSSASAQIEASQYSLLRWLGRFSLTPPRPLAAGEHSRTTVQGSDGPEDVPNYALVQGIFIGCVAAYLIVLALIGPEKHGSHFERAKTAFQAGASKEDVSSITAAAEEADDVKRSSVGSESAKEKEDVQHVENRKPAKDGLV